MPNGWIGFAAAMAVAGLAALVIGAISLRTRGVYFIMITLAFAQMLFYLANSIKAYGGDEGLNIRQRVGFRPRSEPEGRHLVLLPGAGGAGAGALSGSIGWPVRGSGAW